MIILSQHLVPRDSESPPSPPKFRIFLGDGKKTFGANAPTPKKTCTKSPPMQNSASPAAVAYLRRICFSTTRYAERIGGSVR